MQLLFEEVLHHTGWFMRTMFVTKLQISTITYVLEAYCLKEIKENTQ